SADAAVTITTTTTTGEPAVVATCDTTTADAAVTGPESTAFTGGTPATDVTDTQAVDAAARTAAADVVWTPGGTTLPQNPATTTTNAATGPAPIVTSGISSDGTITLSVNRTAEVKTSVPVKRVSI